MNNSQKPSSASLGSGMLAAAARKLTGRARSIDDAVNAATGGSPGQADRSKYNWDHSGSDKKSDRYKK